MRFGSTAILCLAFAFLAAGLAAEEPAPHWQISGQLVEACTCKVPCTCQFGEGPSPGPGCRSLTTLAIEKGSRAGVALDGTKLAFVLGEKGMVIYFDAVRPEQQEALKAIAAHIAEASESKVKAFLPASISQSSSPSEIRTSVGDAGSFEAQILTGFDGKTPVVVENNGDVNVPRLEKGKTRVLKYQDSFGNAIDASGTNSDRGHFDWTDQTKAYL